VNHQKLQYGCILDLVVASNKVLAAARTVKLRVQSNCLDWSIEVDCLVVVRRIQAVNYDLSTTLNYSILTGKC